MTRNGAETATGTGPGCWTADPDGIIITLRVTPRAKANAIGPIAETGDGRCVLAVRLAAPPVDGAANKALLKMVADAFGVSRSVLSLVAGESARIKRVRIAGDPAALGARADAIGAG